MQTKTTSHSEVSILAFTLWIEDVLDGNIDRAFEYSLPRNEGFITLWVGPKTIGSPGKSYRDGDHYRMTCPRCNGTGEVSFVGAIRNQYTASGHKDCFFCGRHGFHILPPLDRARAAILVMAMQTMDSREHFSVPGHEALHAFLRAQIRFAEGFSSDLPVDAWEVQATLFCAEVNSACYETFSSEELSTSYPEAWALAEKAYARFQQKQPDVRRFLDLLDELLSFAP